jgi:hypothetical protein
MTLRRRGYLVEGGRVFEPVLGPSTSTDEIMNQIIDAVNSKKAKAFKLGKLTATLDGHVWTVKYGSKTGRMMGGVFFIPTIVKVWLGKIEWSDLWPD